MIAINKEQPDDENPGGQGVLVDAHHSRGDMVLVRRAIREEWKISKTRRAEIISRLMGIVKGSDDERNIIGASKAVLTADAINAKREATEAALENAAKQQGQPINVAVGVTVQQIMQAERERTGFLEYESIRLASGGHAPDAPARGSNGHGGANGHGPAPGTDQSGID